MTLLIDSRHAFLTPAELVPPPGAHPRRAASRSEPDWVEWNSIVDLRAKRWHAEIGRQVIGMTKPGTRSGHRRREGYGYVVFGVSPGEVVGSDPMTSRDLDVGVTPYLGADGPTWTPQFPEIDGKTVLIVTVPPPKPGDSISVFQKTFEGSEVSYPRGTIYIRKRAGPTSRSRRP